MQFVIFVILGGLTGMFGRRFMSGQGYGIVPDTVLGVAGGAVGGWLATLIFGSATIGFLIALVVTVAGAAGAVAAVHSAKSGPART
jgi:uncharacterized membrane protein YeaQ/YmgE (transglycosylase-associated protein family)